MRATEKYLKNNSTVLINDKPNSNLGIIVTIPAFNEAELIKSLDSLLACDKPSCAVELIVNVNFPEQSSETTKYFNKQCFSIVENFAKHNSTESFNIYILFSPNQKTKTAGVGLARKQAMDEAFRRFISIDNENGIITGFDADSVCDKNYFTEIENLFGKNIKAKACSIRFQHPLKGSKYSPEIYEAVALYELHLRYFINAQKIIRTPYAYQTVGSSFAVRAKYYAQVNGMSPKKAGEDFYFLQKVIALGGFSNLNSTCVYPSSRISNRVGFGTGPSVAEISETGEKLTYNLKSFFQIKLLFDSLLNLYNGELSFKNLPLDPLFLAYLEKQKADAIIENLKKNNKDFIKFKAAFMQWFGGFQILKILNILAHSQEFKYISVIQAVNELSIVEKSDDVFKLLHRLREFDAK